MLVLTRKQQEKIQIGDNITITVLRTKGKAVRLGIEAPESIAVLRGELAARERDNHDDQEPKAPAEKTKSAGASARPNGDWPTESPSSASDGAISLQRVPRSRVATVLPKMLGENAGPLRAMLDRRPAVQS